MIDTEKVLHGLSSCSCDYGVPNICEVTECPYREHKAWCVHELAHDAFRLIKQMLEAQEPVRPMTGSRDRDIQLFNCGACGGVIGAGGIAKYCFHCGRAVKWDG